jgi:threonine dehydratase
MQLPDITAVERAADVIEPFIHHTPVIHSQSINEMLGCQVHFKCENLQRTGSFKIRGASHAVASIDRGTGITGVIAHSSGNHAAALACAAQQHQMNCEIVMPRNASQFKQQAVTHYGGHTTLCEPGMAARESVTAELMARRPELHLVHPYDDHRVIAGQGTVTLELVQQVEDLDMLVVPVGGGGLISGASIVLQSLYPDIQLIGVEPEVVGEAQRSLAEGRRYPATGNPTIADGLQAGIGETNFAIMRQGVESIVTVSEQQIRAAVRLILERLKVVVEPSAAVTLAAMLCGKINPVGKRVGLILSGGNIQLDNIQNLI